MKQGLKAIVTCLVLLLQTGAPETTGGEAGPQTTGGETGPQTTEGEAAPQTTGGAGEEEATSSPSVGADPILACNERWQKCGGVGWTGALCCEQGDMCQYGNEWYSQCVPDPDATPPPTPSPTQAETTAPPTPPPRPPPVAPPGASVMIPEQPPARPIPLWSWGSWIQGYLGIYAPFSSAAYIKDGESACGGGGTEGATSFACPSTLLLTPDMKFAAEMDGNHWAVYAVAGLGSDAECGTCYQLKAEDPDGHPDRLWIVQAVNSGSDVSQGQFDIHVAGGGLGLFNACSGDCAASSGCGTCSNAPHGMFAGTTAAWAPGGSCFTGGAHSVDECDALSTEEIGNYKDSTLIRACKQALSQGWHSNFEVSYARIRCPETLTRVTGMARTDDTDLPRASPSLEYTNNGYTTTMQDCCKPSCSWPGKVAAVSAQLNAVYSCDASGLPLM